MKRYIVAPLYDWAFFLAPPVLCLILGMTVGGLHVDSDATGFLTGVMVHAHLIAVLFRSHGNAEIRRRFPIRFFVVPIVLYLAIVASTWLAIAATVVATFWDVWHSGAQTFGFARIYERNRSPLGGTPSQLTRRLDFWLSQLLYAGPVLAGVTLVDHLAAFDGFAEIGDAFFASIPARVEGAQGVMTWILLGIGGAFIALYIATHVLMARRGHRPSWLKVWMLASTGAVSIYTWGFNTWGEAFLIMNVFHAVQYLALVWAMEGKRIAALVKLPARPRLVVAIYLASTLLYGIGVELLDSSITTLWAFTMVVSLMHFWYDAFIWSVRKADV